MLTSNDDVDLHIDGLLRSNVARVFNERDPQLRLRALEELWAEDASMFEAEERFVGREAISANVGALLARLPEGVRFSPAGPAIVNHDTAMLRWTAATPGEPPKVTGTDLAFISDGRIQRMYVFLDPHSP
jgi:hypothetical protein